MWSSPVDDGREPAGRGSGGIEAGGGPWPKMPAAAAIVPPLEAFLFFEPARARSWLDAAEEEG